VFRWYRSAAKQQRCLALTTTRRSSDSNNSPEIYRRRRNVRPNRKHLRELTNISPVCVLATHGPAGVAIANDWGRRCPTFNPMYLANLHGWFLPTVIGVIFCRYSSPAFSGVAGYGALGHVPPRLPTVSFLVHFEVNRSESQLLCSCEIS